MSGLTGYLLSNGTDLSYVFAPIGVSLNANNIFTGTNTFSSKLTTSAGIVAPVASLTYTSDMIGYSFNNTPQTLTTFASGAASAYASQPITTGVWLVFANQVILKNNGSFGLDSYTISTGAITSGGTGNVFTPGQAYNAIPGYTSAQVNTQYSYTVQITSATATITTSDTTLMTVGTGSPATRSIRMSFTRIA